jgi:hypothetical protein
MHRTTLAWIVMVGASTLGFAACDAGSRSPFALEPAGHEQAVRVEPRRCPVLSAIEGDTACKIPGSPVDR